MSGSTTAQTMLVCDAAEPLPASPRTAQEGSGCLGLLAPRDDGHHLRDNAHTLLGHPAHTATVHLADRRAGKHQNFRTNVGPEVQHLHQHGPSEDLVSAMPYQSGSPPSLPSPPSALSGKWQVIGQRIQDALGQDASVGWVLGLTVLLVLGLLFAA